jgi:serine/threonine-protein kinase
MSGDAPTEIGPYTITREIGRGGMGVVYLARDTTLDRDVAIKCLPNALAGDADRLARFEREAKMLASLNHASIASIFGLEEVDDRRYLILEYVPGDTLDQVLEHGPMPVSEALPVAKQIAEAIESAHERGIIHRDLKPANIKFAGGDQVKVLDFGIAKAFETTPTTATDIAASPTYIPTTSPTMPGVVMGTAGYLSPEQARGRTVDKRSDIFSFGCLLYEMLTGKQLFPGETVADSLGATLHREPIWNDLPDDTPPTILLLLRRCLTKDRKRRLHDIADARVELEEAISDPTSSTLGLAGGVGVPRRVRTSWIAAVALVVGAALATTAFVLPRLFAPREPAPPVMRLDLNVPHPAPPFGEVVAASRDNRVLAIRHLAEGDGPALVLRRLEQDAITPLPNLGSAPSFTFSPDGRWIAHTIRDGIARSSIEGGPATTLCESGFGIGLHWAPDGWIYFCDFQASRLLRIRENGGDPEVLVALEDDEDRRRQTLHSPCVLPGESTLLYTYSSGPEMEEASEIRAYSLVDGTTRTLIRSASQPHYVSTGHLVFLRGTTLMAAPFDAVALELRGPAAPIVEDIRVMDFVEIGMFDLAGDGTLYHVSGNVEQAGESVVVADLDGTRSPLISLAWEDLDHLRMSPDGSRVAVKRGLSEENDEESIWIIDVARDTPVLLTTEEGDKDHPIWSPDGEWVYYCWEGAKGVESGIYRRRSDFGGEPELVYGTEKHYCLSGFDPEGTRLFALDGGDGDLVAIETGDAPTLEPWLATPARELDIAVSPNGRWAAYTSTETGSPELYVRSIDGGQKQRISNDGVRRAPFWSPDGATLYFRSPVRSRAGGMSMNAVNVISGHETAEDGAAHPDTPFDWEPPVALFDLTRDTEEVLMHPDGERFVMIASLDEDGTADAQDEQLEIHVTLNFHEELKRLAPVED